MLRRYTFKLYPKPAQEAALRETASMCAQLWNALLQRREDVYRREKRTLTAFDLGKEITELRAECPEWASMPRTIQERVCGDLDNAFKAFFRRAKAGEKRAGYPKYKPTRDAVAIPLREMIKGGWSFAPTGSVKAESGGCEPRAGRSVFSGREAKFDRNSETWPQVSGGEPENAGETQGLRLDDAGGEPENAVDAQGAVLLDPGALDVGQPAVDAQARRGRSVPLTRAGRSDRTSSNWRLYLKVCPGRIRARGQFPAVPSIIKTADIKFYAGAWWLSVAVEIERKREHGSDPTRVHFDLLDEFARVERAEGACVSPGRFSNAETTKMPNVSTGSTSAGAEPGEVGAERRLPSGLAVGAEPNETRAERRVSLRAEASGRGAEPDETVDAIKSERDRRYKRGSIRWLREKQRAAKLSAREARQRREALHLWSSRLIASASSVSVTTPSIKEETASGRGTAQRWGAAVEIKAKLNRHVLSMAPSSAIQMLSYKAAEAAIEFVLLKDENPVVAVGNDLVATTKKARSVRAAIRKEKKNGRAVHRQDADPGEGQ